jgi:hypothetical protein
LDSRACIVAPASFLVSLQHTIAKAKEKGASEFSNIFMRQRNCNPEFTIATENMEL